MWLRVRPYVIIMIIMILLRVVIEIIDGWPPDDWGLAALGLVGTILVGWLAHFFTERRRASAIRTRNLMRYNAHMNGYNGVTIKHILVKTEEDDDDDDDDGETAEIYGRGA
jgi:hypothetical protein